MTRPKILFNFNRYSNPALLSKANVILIAMSGNPAFSSPAPTLAYITDAYDAFVTVSAVVNLGDRTQIPLRNVRRKELMTLLESLAGYVTYTANSNYVALATSGFDMEKGKTPTPPIGNPQNLILKDGLNPGSIDISVNPVPFATSYLVELTIGEITANTVWQTQGCSRSKCTITDLLPGTYSCRVAAIGTKKQIAYSDIVSWIVR